MAKRATGNAAPASVGDSGDGTATLLNSVEPAFDSSEPIADGDRAERVDSSDGGFVNPADAAGTVNADNAGNTPRRKRGRPPGSGNRTGTGTAKRTSTASASDLSAILFSLHAMGAALTKTPELMLDESEAKQLSDAIARVTALYDVPMLDEKTMAWVGLAMAAGSIYGPRFVAVKVKGAKKQRGPQAVPQPTIFTPSGFPSGMPDLNAVGAT